jgi:cytochrome P450
VVEVAKPPAPAGFDPFSPEYLEDPHGYWDSLGSHPVFFYEPLQAFVVTGRDDVATVLTDWQTYSSRLLRAAPLPEENVEEVAPENREIPGKLMKCAYINIDPPGHTVDRKNSQKAFTRPLVAATEPAIRQLANDLIDRFAERGECDLMSEFAHPLTLGVIVHMVGLPADQMPEFRHWIDDFFGLMLPEGAPVPYTAEEIVGRYNRVGEAYEFFDSYLAERRAEPREDLASAMINATDADGKPALSYDQVLTHLLELAAAGSETTASLIGHMVRYFTADPALREGLEADPERWEETIEEGLRRSAIINNLMRVTTTDTEIGGVAIPAGSAVLVNIAGSSTDPESFAEPLAFDPDRENLSDHLAFGTGRHFCLGAPLARLEARCALQELYARLPGLTVVPEAPVEYAGAMTVRTIKALHVRWDV